MKTLLVVGSLLLWTGYIMATALLGVLPKTESEPGLAVLFTSGSTVAVIGSALLFAAIRANVADPATPAGRRYYRRLAVVFVVLVAVSIILSTIGAIVRNAPAWVPVAHAVLTLVCSLGPVAAAARYRRTLSDDTDREWQAPPTERSRVFRRMAIVLVITAVATAILMFVLQSTVMDDQFTALDFIALSLSFGAIAAVVPALMAVWGSSAAINRIFGTDIESRTLVAKAIMRRQPDTLTDEQKVMGARFAHVTRAIMPIQTAQALLIIVGVVLAQIPNVVRGSVSPVLAIAFAALAVFLVLALIFGRRQYLAVRAYTEAHPIESAS